MSVRPDNRLADAPMTAVECRTCGACVLARKSSWEQTSVQWDAGSSRRCPQRREAEALSGHGPQSVFLSCSALADSISQAVRAGTLQIVDEITDMADSAS